MNRSERKRTVELYINQERKAAFERLQGLPFTAIELDEEGKEAPVEREIDSIKTLFYLGFDRIVAELTQEQEEQE